MPRLQGPQRTSAWSGASDGYNRAIDFVTATGFYAGVGYLLDRWLGTWPLLFVIGAVVGNLTGIYIVYKRSTVAHENSDAKAKAAGVSRSWPATKTTDSKSGDGTKV